MALNASLASLKAVCSTSKLLAPQLPNRELRRFLHSSSKYAATRLTEASNEPSLAHSASNQSETFGAIPDQDQIDASWSPRTYQVLDRAERDRRLFAQFSSRDDLPQLIRRLCRYGQIKEARTRLQNVPRTAEIDACWLSVIGACLQRAKYNGAFAIWTDFRAGAGVLPDSAYAAFFNNIDPLAATEVAIQYAETVFEQYVSASAHDVKGANSFLVLNAFLKLLASSPCVATDDLRSCVSRAQDLGYDVDVVAYAARLQRETKLYDQAGAPSLQDRDDTQLVALLNTILKAHAAQETIIDTLLFSAMISAWKVLYQRHSTSLTREEMLGTATGLAGLPLATTVARNDDKPQVGPIVPMTAHTLRGVMLMANLMSERSSHIAYHWLMHLRERTDAAAEPIIDAKHYESAIYSCPAQAMNLLVDVLQSKEPRLQPHLNLCVAAMECTPFDDAVRILAMMSGKPEFLSSADEPLRPDNSEIAIDILNREYARAGYNFRVRCCKILLKSAQQRRSSRQLQKAMDITESYVDVFRVFRSDNGDGSLMTHIGRVSDLLGRSVRLAPERREVYNKYAKTARILRQHERGASQRSMDEELHWEESVVVEGNAV